MMEAPRLPVRNPSTTALAGSATLIAEEQAESVESFDRPLHTDPDYDEDSGAVSLADESDRSLSYSRTRRAHAGCPSVSAACGTVNCAMLDTFDQEHWDHEMRPNIILPNLQKKNQHISGCRQEEMELLHAAAQLTSVLPPGAELDHKMIDRIKKLRSSLLRLPSRFDDGDSTTQFSIQQNEDGDKTSTLSRTEANESVPIVKTAEVVGDAADVQDVAKPECERAHEEKFDEMVSASMQTIELKNVGVQCPDALPDDNSVVYFHDVVPRALSVSGTLLSGGEIVYESIPVLLARANKWLQRNFMCKARFVEIVRLPSKAACHAFEEELESDEIETARGSSYFTATPDKPTFVKALRLWLTHNNDAGMVPQQLGHYYAMPFAPLGDPEDKKLEGRKAKSATLERLRRFAAHPNSLFDTPYGPGGDGPQVSSAMEHCKFGQLVDEVNRIAEQQNLRGKILSVLTDIAPIHQENSKDESASFQFGEDKVSYCEKRQPTCTVLRVFYELGSLKIPRIRIKDFVPERVSAPHSQRSHETITFAEIFGLGYRNRSKGARKKRKVYQGYAELHEKVADWFNRQQSIALKHHGRCPAVNLVTIQTVLMKTAPNGKLDTNRTVFLFATTPGQSQEYVKFLRVAYTAQTFDPKNVNKCDLQKRLYLSRKVFLPARLPESKLSTLEAVVTGRKPSLESNQDIWRRIAEFVATRSLKGNFFAVETLPMPFECFEGLEKCQRSYESEENDAQPEPSSFLVDPRLTDHTWVTAFQVYFYALENPCLRVGNQYRIGRVESDTFDVEAGMQRHAQQCPRPEVVRAVGGTERNHKKSSCCVM